MKSLTRISIPCVGTQPDGRMSGHPPNRMDMASRARGPSRQERRVGGAKMSRCDELRRRARRSWWRPGPGQSRGEDCSSAFRPVARRESRWSRRRPGAARPCSFARGSMDSAFGDQRRLGAGRRGERDRAAVLARGGRAAACRRRCRMGSVEKLTPTPEFDGRSGGRAARFPSSARWETPCVLVLDDLHELQLAGGARPARAPARPPPPLLHVVLATRRDPQLGLHRLRLSVSCPRCEPPIWLLAGGDARAARRLGDHTFGGGGRPAPRAD